MKIFILVFLVSSFAVCKSDQQYVRGSFNPDVIQASKPGMTVYENHEKQVFTQEQVNSPDFRCTPFRSFVIDCNTCLCDPSGRRARPQSCTRNHC